MKASAAEALMNVEYTLSIVEDIRVYSTRIERAPQDR